MANNGLLTLAGGLAGAVAGFFLGGPQGAAIGFSLGAGLAAGFEEKPGVETGRIADNRVTGASYGDAIARVYGTASVPGVMVWSSGLLEKKDKNKEGGSLFSSGTEVTTFTYKMDMAYLLCEGEIEGVGRIWFNGELLYDGSSSAKVWDLSTKNKYWQSLTVYKGSETQTADPTIVSYEGAANVSAMRGMAYIVIKGLRLKRFYNRAPNIKVEVIKTSSTNTAPNVVHDLTTEITARESGILDDGTILTSQVDTSGLDTDYEFDHYIRRLDFYGELLDQIKYEVRLPNTLSNSRATEFQNEPRAIYWRNLFGGSSGRLYWEGQHYATSDHATGTGPLGTDDWQAYGDDEYMTARRGPEGEYYIALTNKTNNQGLIRYLSDSWGRPTFTYDKAEYLDNLWSPDTHTGTNLWLYPDATNVNRFFIFYTAAGVSDTNYVTYWDTDFNLLAQWAKNDGPPLSDQTSGNNFLIGGGYCLIKRSSTSTLADLYTFDETTSGSSWSSSSVSITNTVNFSSFIPLGENLAATRYQILTTDELVVKGGQSLQAVVEELHDDAGYSSAEYDMSALSGTVQGFVIPSPGSTRDSIQQLQLAHYFDLVEIDYKSSGVMRGGSSVQTFTSDDLAGHMADADVPDIIRRERGAELELPRSVTLKYLNRVANYETGTQAATRQITDANKDSVLSLNIVLNDDEAIQAAHVILYNEHSGVEQLRFSVTEKYSKLVPSDLVTVPDDVDSVLVRITEVSENLRGLLDITAIPEYVEVYTQSMAGSESSTDYADLISQNGPALLGWFDIPMLTDADDSLGVYAGASGYLSTWTGHDLYKFLDSLNDYNKIASFVDSARIGTAESALGDHTSGAVDWDNTVTIRLADSTNTLTSSTETTVIEDSTINRAVIGRDTRYEVIQFVTATSLGGGRYTLSGLLRGRRGTEYAIDEHESGDVFALLDVTDINRLIYESAEVGADLQHKLVGRDDLITDVTTRRLEFNGYAKLPFAPARVEASQSGADWVITWEPRTRFNTPILEDSSYSDDSEIESYTVDFLDGSGVVQGSYSVTVGTETRTYTSAEQTTDFGSAQSDIIVIVYQKGTTLATEGHGYQLTTSTDAREIVEPKA